ncbi:MAG: zinc-ribbon domain-containing protein [Solirubrobacterales bacterium]
MTATRYCHRCGSPLAAEANFCRGCGAPRALEAEDARSQAPGDAARSTAHDLGAVADGGSQPPVAPQAWPGTTSDASPHGRDAGGSLPDWAVAVAATVALILIAGVIAALALTSGGKGREIDPAIVPTVTTSEAGDNPSAPATDAKHSSPSRTPSAPQSTYGAGEATAPAGYTLYRGRRFTARVPSGWRQLEDEAQKEGYVESKWQSPSGTEDTILIDTSPATDLTLEQDAAPVHADLERVSGYEQLSYGPGDLSGVDSWMWVFRVPGDQRIDYFFNSCARAFGVLGSSPASHFEQMRGIYRAVAQSTQAVCN